MRKLSTSIFLVSLFILCTNILEAQQRPAIKWQKNLGGTMDDRANDILLNNDGTMVVAGSSKSNDGNVTGHHGSTNITDAWVAKLDGDGNLLWQKSIGGTNEDQFNSVIASGDGGYLCIGYTKSSDGDLASNNGGADFFLVKLNNAGTILWKQNYGGTKSDIAISGVLTSDGGFAVMGTSYSSDGDVQSGLLGRTVADAWVLKIDGVGNTVWEKCLYYGDGTKDNAGVNILEAEDQSLVAYTAGSTYYEYTYDTEIYRVYENPGIVYALDKTTGASTFKLNTSGDANHNMCKGYGKYYFAFQNYTARHPPLNCNDQYSVIADASNNLSTIRGSQQVSFYDCFNSNIFGGVKSFAPVNGLALLTNSSVAVVGSMELNQFALTPLAAMLILPGNGSAFSTFTYSGGEYYPTGFNSIKVMPTGDEYVVAGYSSGISNDVTGNHGGTDCWILRLQNSNKITGNVFVDNNSNGTQDTGEPGFGKAIVKSTKYGVSQYAIPVNGTYQNSVDTGTFFTTLQIQRPYYTTTNTGELSTFTTYKNQDTINFPVKPIPGIKDYAVFVIPLDAPRPGLVQSYTINYANIGTDTLLNKQIIFVKDRRSALSYAAPSVSAISGDTLKWNVTNVLPDSMGNIRLGLLLDAIPQLGIGDTIICSAYIDSTGDISTGDNSIILRQRTRGSYDPNDKNETHGGFISPLEMAAEKYLTYTIRFQNTGNEAAANIILRDTLEAKIDGASIEIVSSSHTYNFNLKNGKYATWAFNNINLPDSFSNEPLSHGYVTYRIKPLPGFVTGDTIQNTAFIYFDFNPPVVTNTQLTIFKAEKCVWTGVISTAWENRLNWANGKVPDSGTDVFINGATTNNPEINSAAVCRIIYVNPTATIKVNTGKSLTVGGEYLPRTP